MKFSGLIDMMKFEFFSRFTNGANSAQRRKACFKPFSIPTPLVFTMVLIVVHGLGVYMLYVRPRGVEPQQLAFGGHAPGPLANASWV